MGFSLKIKGEKVEPKPSAWHQPGTLEGAFPFKSEDHAESIAWHCYIEMAVLRDRCVELYEEFQELAHEVDEMEGHPKIGKARKRLADLDAKICGKQVKFLEHERAVDYCWRSFSPKDRESRGFSFWFNQPSMKENVWGCWDRHFEASPKPPRSFALQPDALKFASPEQKRGYLLERHGTEFLDEEDGE